MRRILKKEREIREAMVIRTLQTVVLKEASEINQVKGEMFDNRNHHLHCQLFTNIRIPQVLRRGPFSKDAHQGSSPTTHAAFTALQVLLGMEPTA